MNSRSLVQSLFGFAAGLGLCADLALAQVDRAVGLLQTDGVVRAAGPGYRAEFAPGTLDVVPALGESVLQAQFLRLHFAALDRGATSLWRAPAAEGAAARPELRGDAVHWELAPGFTARAEPTLAGVELSFLLEQRPAGCGDLYLALELETSLPQLPGTLRFELPGGGGLTIGGVTAIDALGERTAGEIRLAPGGSRLELQVSGEFVDAAAYPLLIDPLIGPSSEVSGTSEAFSPDVAAAPDHGMYLVAYEVAFAATSRDLHARRVDAAGVPVGPVLLLESGSGLGRKPKVAYVRSTGHFVVAWDESATLFHDRDVHARTVLAADGALAGGTIKVASGSDDQFGCQIGGEASTSADRALVIWSLNGTVQRRFVRVLGSGSLQLSGAAQFLLGGLTHPVFEPRVSRAGGEVGRWVVTGGEFGLSGGNTVRGLALLLDRQGNELALQGIDTWPNVSSYRGTAVDGDGTQFLVASRPPFGARKLTWTGAALEVGELTALPAATASGSPAVALAQAEYLVAWEEPVSGLDAELRVVGLETDTCLSCEPIQVLGSLGSFDHDPALAAMWSAAPLVGPQIDRALLTWTAGEVAAPFGSGVQIQLLEAQGSGGAVVDLGGSCAGGGAVEIGDPVLLGNQAFSVRLSGAAPTALAAILNVALSPLPVVCGPCAWLPFDLTFPPVAVVGGQAAQPLPLPCLPQLHGLTVQVQWTVVGTATSPCPIAPGVGVSNALGLTFGS